MVSRAGRRGVDWRPGPLPILPGSALFGIGSVLDLTYHLAPDAWVPTLNALLGEDGQLAHLALFFGMALIVVGLVITGLLRSGPAARHSGQRPVRVVRRQHSELGEPSQS